MLPDFFQVTERTLQFLEEGTHASECCSFEHLGAIQRVSVLEEANIVVRDGVDYSFGLVNVPKSQLVMVLVVEHVHQICVEWVNVVQFWEPVNNSTQFFLESLLHEFNLSHVELSDSLDLETSRDLGGRLPLSFRQ